MELLQPGSAVLGSMGLHLSSHQWALQEQELPYHSSCSTLSISPHLSGGAEQHPGISQIHWEKAELQMMESFQYDNETITQTAPEPTKVNNEVFIPLPNEILLWLCYYFFQSLATAREYLRSNEKQIIAIESQLLE